MKATRYFEEFIETEIIRKQSPNKSRAEFLMNEAENSYDFLLEKTNKLGICDKTANDYVKSCYDIIMELIRALMYLKGYTASGQSAHEAEVSYLRLLKFNEKEIQFMDQIRYFRNGMLYYGTIIDKEYAEKTIEFTEKIYIKLNIVLNSQL